MGRERRRSARLAAAAVRAPGQLKQQIQPTILSPSYQLRKKHKLKLSSSSSSSLPYQLMSEHEKMDKKKARKWTTEEDKYLAELTQEKELAELYKTWKAAFNEKVAARLNKRFENYPNFVPFTAGNVKNKVGHSKRAYLISEESTSSGTPAGVLFSHFGPAFLDSAKGTSSRTLSGASHARSGPFTSPAKAAFTSPATGGPSNCCCVPTDLLFTPEQAAAVKYLAAGNGEKFSHGKELQIFTDMLCGVPRLAQSFHLMPDDYEKRRNSLIDLFQHGGKGVPNMAEDELPEDFRKKPPQE